jgi:regulator of protease activity HflC (stomatin/prohibitin superfamily)
MNIFSILGEFMGLIIKCFPHLLNVRATCCAVKWVKGKKVVGLGPGLHWYWPITTVVEQIVTARQTLNLPTQVLTTKDRKSVVVGGLAVYRINDVVRAIGERNFDVDDTVRDVCMAALMEVVTDIEFDEFFSDPRDVSRRLTTRARASLRKFGVYIVSASLTDLSQCRCYRVIGDGNT